MDNSRCRDGRERKQTASGLVMDRDGKIRRNAVLKNDAAVNFISKPIKKRVTNDVLKSHENIFVHGINCDSRSCCIFGRRENLHSCQLAEADDNQPFPAGSFRFDTCDLFNSSLWDASALFGFFFGLDLNQIITSFEPREWWVGGWLNQAIDAWLTTAP